MTEFLFPDNTVLCNFASVNRLDLLRSVLDGRGRWTGAVAYEASQSARFLPDLSRLATETWLGEPIEIDDEAEALRINFIRRAVFGGSDDEPLKHLGEAETCYVILNKRDFAGSWWISDDRDSLRYARHQGITTRETIDLVGMAVGIGEITAQDAFDLMRKMADHDRRLRLPVAASDLRR
jgi:predicted nucleic acid-binding protein